MGHPAIGTRSERRRWSALALIVTAQFMVILDVAIVTVALPSIQLDLGFSHESLQWVALAPFLLPAARSVGRTQPEHPSTPP